MITLVGERENAMENTLVHLRPRGHFMILGKQFMK